MPIKKEQGMGANFRGKKKVGPEWASGKFDWHVPECKPYHITTKKVPRHPRNISEIRSYKYPHQVPKTQDFR